MSRSVLFVAVLAAALSGCTGKGPAALPPQPGYALCFEGARTNYAVRNFSGHSPNAIVERGGKKLLEFRLNEKGKADPKWGIDTAWGVDTDPFPVRPGGEYVVRLTFAGDAPARAVRPGAHIHWLKADGKPLVVQDALGKDVEYVDPPLKVPTRVNGAAETMACTRGEVPPNAAMARITLAVDVPNIKKGECVALKELSYFDHPHGERWVFDDIDAPALEVLTPSPCADFTSPVRFRVTDASGVDWQTFRCLIDGREVAMTELKRTGDELEYRPTSPWEERSVHGIEIFAADVNGFRGADCGFIAFTKSAAAHPVSSVRADGMMLRDGKPFFPLGVFNVSPNEKNGKDVERDIAEMASHGMNVAHTYMRRPTDGNPVREAAYASLVAACAKHGVLLYSEPGPRPQPCANPGPFGDEAERFRIIAENVFGGRAYPALLGWGIGDDTSDFVSPEGLKRIHRFCRAIDPAVFTISADVCRAGGANTPLVPYADLLLVENYPIRGETPQDDELAKCADTLDNAWLSVRLAKCPNRTVMAIPQCFKGWRSWKRYPSKEEIRAQAFLSLACRARGLVWYTSFSPREGNEGPFNSPERRREFFEVMDEVVALVPSLVREDAKGQPTVTVVKGPTRNVLDGDSVRVLLKEDGLLLCANTSHRAVTADIRLPDGKIVRRELRRNGAFAEKVFGKVK